jgi:hypothetical protein
MCTRFDTTLCVKVRWRQVSGFNVWGENIWNPQDFSLMSIIIWKFESKQFYSTEELFSMTQFKCLLIQIMASDSSLVNILYHGNWWCLQKPSY